MPTDPAQMSEAEPRIVRANSDMIPVMICVNNPDNGHYSGRCAGISVDDLIGLESCVLPEPRCTLKLDARTFSIHRTPFAYRSHKPWVGNWCWDCIWLTCEDLARLIHLCLSQAIPVQGQRSWDVWRIDRAEGKRCIAMMDRVLHGDKPSVEEWESTIRACLLSTVREAKGGAK